ncbi:MAG: SAM-dependent methyltransferase [Actinoallomurus sp.]
MTSQPAVPPTADQVTDYYGALGPLLQMAWGDNFHFGYWDGPSDTSSPAEATDRFTDLLVERLRVGVGDRVLDVGCGIGRPALRLASTTGAGVLGVTISRQQVEQASELARVEGVSDQVSFEYADGMDMPFEADSFDAVLAFESIVHMDRAIALREMTRVLKPGGRVVLTDVFTVSDDASDSPSSGATDETSRKTDGPDISSWLKGIDDYPALVAGANLVLDELIDVTKNIEGTFPRMIDGFLKHRKEFERKHGMTLEQVFDTGALQPNTPAAAGCLVMVAHKP